MVFLWWGKPHPTGLRRKICARRVLEQAGCILRGSGARLLRQYRVVIVGWGLPHRVSKWVLWWGKPHPTGLRRKICARRVLEQAGCILRGSGARLLRQYRVVIVGWGLPHRVSKRVLSWWGEPHPTVLVIPGRGCGCRAQFHRPSRAGTGRAVRRDGTSCTASR